MPRWYKLDGHNAVPCDSAEGMRLFDTADRVVKQTKLPECRVSTVFLGFDHRLGSGPPLLFETMIFGGRYDENQWRYSTWNEAMLGHQQAVRIACGEMNPVVE